MTGKVVIVNTHPHENPEFVWPLEELLDSLGRVTKEVNGYDDLNPLDESPSHIFLSGVPLNANYSLSERNTQRDINRHFEWLLDCSCPVMGICFGHQIIGHVFGGKISSLKEAVQNKRKFITWNPDQHSGIFEPFKELVVFAEHRDYISETPLDYKVLCQNVGIPYIIYHQERPIYGVQFVPEKSDERCHELLKRFLDC
jgi:GMP synthase-like glutamine amidotransferase